MKYLYTLFLFTFISLNVLGQDTIKVAQDNFKLKRTDTKYYGFAKGDKVILSFSTLSYKTIKEIEVVDYRSGSVLFRLNNTSVVDNKVLNIPVTGIYKFKFKTSVFKSRDCNYAIYRIPRDYSTKYFNTNVYWKTIYDTVEVTKTHFDTISEVFYNKTVTVHSRTNSNGNKLICRFVLPNNTYRWSYKISIASSDQNDIDCALADAENAQNFLQGRDYKYLNSIKSFNITSPMSSPLSGKYAFMFINHNTFTGIDMTLKIKGEKLRIWKEKEKVVKSHQVPYLK